MSTAAKREPIRLADYRSPAFSTTHVDMAFELAPEATRVTTRLTIARQAHAEPGEPLRLLGDGPKLEAIALDGAPLAKDRWRMDGPDLLVDTDAESFELTLTTLIGPKANTALSGLYVSNDVFCTQCEAEGFRRITFFQDRPDVLARFRVRLVADAARYPVLLSNGNLLETGSLDGGRHFAQWEDPFPKPAYLFALVAGDLALLEDRFTTMSGREVTLRIYSEHACIDQCGHAMESLKKSMRWDEERYGLEYDLDLFQIVAVSDFNMGAMENKGLNIFNTSATLAKRETATDADFLSVERIIAHEYFHNWTGNRVTCRDWFQLTLKEGLTVFRDQQFTEDHHSPAVKRIHDVSLLRESQFLEDSGPLAHPIRPSSYIEINNFYTRTVYEKGAEVIRMIHTLIGEESFRKGMDLYFERHDGQAVTCEDFVAAMADASGRDLSMLMRWYGQAGTPELTVERRYDGDARTLTLDISQMTPPTPGQPTKLPVHIPLRMGLISRQSGRPLPLRLDGENEDGGLERVLELTAARQSFTFVDLEEEPIPSLLRGFSAPVRLDLAQDRDELAFLVARDTDAFARWEAGQRLALDVMGEMLAAHAASATMRVDARLARAMGAVLDDTTLDPALVARAVSLPSRSYLAQRQPWIDVDGLTAVHDRLRLTLGRDLGDRWRSAYERCQPKGAFSLDAAAVAARSLKATALGYMLEGKLGGAATLARAQYDAADNMTDQISALRALCDVQGEGHEDLLARFYAQWSHEPLVVNKWFALQAMMEDDRSLQRVQELMRHKAFSLTNPNRLRSLIGVFCGANMKGFHKPDGSGYAFLGDIVTDLDARNPQIASRLIATLGRWKRYDESRQGLMKAQLERILAKDGLSSDSYEIASKSLAA